jgi:hypothetical protein
MRACLSALAVAALLGIATPALADVGSAPSVQRAVLAASAFGVTGISEIQYWDGKWEIEGRDPRGHTLNVQVDAITGAVVKVDRF